MLENTCHSIQQEPNILMSNHQLEEEVTPMEALLGPTLMQDPHGKVIKSTKQVLESKTLVMLYFSASWCPPCQSFSPKLKQFHQHVQDSVEIVYISSDKTPQDFASFFGTMPWWTLDNTNTNATTTKTTTTNYDKIKKELSKQCKITGIPTLIVLHAGTGGFVTDEARDTIEHWSAAPAKAQFAREIVRQWIQKVPIPLEDARLQGWNEFRGIQGVVMTIMRHPALFLAVVWSGKWIWNKLKELSEQPGDQV